MTSDVAPTQRDPAGFLLRVTVIWAALTMPLARVVAPGLRGNATDTVVVAWQWVGATTSYALAFLLGAVCIDSASTLLRKERSLPGIRGVALSGMLVTMALVAPAFIHRLPSQPGIVLVLAAAIVVMVTASRAISLPVARALGIVLAFFALAALVRLFAWQLAVAAGEQVSDRLYSTSRIIATASVVFEAAGQLAAVAWLGTRGRVVGQMTTVAAVTFGFFLTWGATLGVHHDAARWQAVLHTAFLEAQGVPAPFALSAVATFLLAASYPLAIVAMTQRGDEARTGHVLALALLAHGAFDAPLRALCAVASAVALLASAEISIARKTKPRKQD